MIKPIIAIAGSLYTETSMPFLGDNFDYNNNNYSKCISQANGVPIYLPVIENIDIIEKQLSICDGLLLPGGNDINPLLYNELPRPKLGKCNDLIDWYQITLTNKALEKNIPILGICRGAQVINVACGGTIYQDISYASNYALLHIQNSHLSENCHPIYIHDNTTINTILGNKYIVNSGHHQCINELAPNLKVSSISPDGVIESIEMTNRPFVIGVQWHPEMLALKDNKMLQLFNTFIDNCNNYNI
ncbi:gamma-glutamyl-gamma-aminobutyrate hydrolase family protein [Clostridioides difficile]